MPNGTDPRVGEEALRRALRALGVSEANIDATVKDAMQGRGARRGVTPGTQSGPMVGLDRILAQGGAGDGLGPGLPRFAVGRHRANPLAQVQSPPQGLIFPGGSPFPVQEGPQQAEAIGDLLTNLLAGNRAAGNPLGRGIRRIGSAARGLF